MEYVQMTLDDWVQMKQKLRQELIGVKQSFVRIGYALRQIDDQRLYENDGYKSIAEFAKAEYGLEASTTSRFMSINREYSIDGYSEHLRPEYTDLGRSQLEEMLKLPDSDRQMIQPEASREDIRELKRFNKTEPAAGVADDTSQLIEKFFEENKDILNEVYSNEFDEESMSRFAEIVNPAGNRSFKKGLYFMMMYENRVTIKKFGDTPKNMSWWEFYQVMRSIFDEDAAGTRTWQNHFGGDKQLELRGMNAEFYKDMIDDYVYYWSLKKKLISDIKSKGLRYKTINGNGVVVEKTNDSVVNLQKTTATMLKILADLRLKDPVPEPEKATDGYL